MHLVRWVTDGSCFAVAAFVLMRGGAPSPPAIRFAGEVLGGPTNIIKELLQMTGKMFIPKLFKLKTLSWISLIMILLLVIKLLCRILILARIMDRNRGRRQQSKEYMKDVSHIPFRSLDPALCKNRVSGDPMVTDRQRFGTLNKLTGIKIPDERKRNHGTVSAYEAFDPICILGWYMNLES